MSVKKSESTAVEISKPKNETQLATQIQALQSRVEAFQVTCKEDCEVGLELRERIKGARGWLEELFGAPYEAAKTSYYTIRDKYNGYDKPLEAADKVVQGKVRNWVSEQERLERQERERVRLEDEKRRIAEEEERREKAAQNLIDSGKVDEAEELLEAPVEIEKPRTRMIETQVPQMDKRSLGRDKWRADVVNFKKLFDAVAKGDVPLQALEPNQKFLDGQAKLFKDTDALNYPGVVVVKE
jgi:hypothetical protein